MGTEQNGILKTINGGSTWTRLRSGIRHSADEYPEIYDISVAPTDSITVSDSDENKVVAGDDLVLSTDALATTTTVVTNSSDRRFQDITFAPSDSTVVYAITDGWQETSGYYFYRSTDSGANFTLVKQLRSQVLDVQP